MTTDGVYTAVVDRFEDDLAVLLLEDDDETVAEIIIDRKRLPDDGQHVDAVLCIELEDDEVVTITYDADETVDRSEEIQQRFDDLSQRPPSTEDDPDSA